ncbi:hypothetical protein TWF694_008783 [Orbilia ellipsospora]|uniref:Uncharacterized protein n=1 Tax=Orbilia ellipsospora TaxID=2528407 RepID=A0AAV9XCX6_9PEZI
MRSVLLIAIAGQAILSAGVPLGATLDAHFDAPLTYLDAKKAADDFVEILPDPPKGAVEDIKKTTFAILPNTIPGTKKRDTLDTNLLQDPSTAALSGSTDSGTLGSIADTRKPDPQSGFATGPLDGVLGTPEMVPNAQVLGDLVDNGQAVTPRDLLATGNKDIVSKLGVVNTATDAAKGTVDAAKDTTKRDTSNLNRRKLLGIPGMGAGMPNPTDMLKVGVVKSSLPGMPPMPGMPHIPGLTRKGRGDKNLRRSLLRRGGIEDGLDRGVGLTQDFVKETQEGVTKGQEAVGKVSDGTGLLLGGRPTQ